MTTRWWRRHPDKHLEHVRRSQLKRIYGITPEQYDEMFRRGKGACWVCKYPPKKRRLAIDHDHITNRVRALLCHRCNRMRMGTNTAETARRVLDVLESDFDGRKL